MVDELAAIEQREEPHQGPAAHRPDQRDVEQAIGGISLRADVDASPDESGIADGSQHRRHLAVLAVDGEPIVERLQLRHLEEHRRGIGQRTEVEARLGHPIVDLRVVTRRHHRTDVALL